MSPANIKAQGFSLNVKNVNSAILLHQFYTTFVWIMKLTAFILSIFVLSMATVPCTDGEDQLSESISEGHLVKPFHQHSESSEDGCTPFCICQCCGTSVIIPTPTVLSNFNKSILFSYSFQYSFNYSCDYSNGVWHPPAIG